MVMQDKEPVSVVDFHVSFGGECVLHGMDLHWKCDAHRRTLALLHWSGCAVSLVGPFQSVPDLHYQNEQRREVVKHKGKLCRDSRLLPHIVILG